MTSDTSTVVSLHGVDVPVVRQGSGPPVLVLHGGDGPLDRLTFGESLSGSFELMHPTHPGFGGTPIPEHFDSLQDLIFLYLDLIDSLDLKDAILMGFSMGAATSILAAAEEPRITAVAADSPYANASDLIAREAARKTPIPGWLTPIFMPAARLLTKWIYGIDIGALVPERAVAGLGYPVLVIHGIADERIPWRQGQRVASAAETGSSIWLVPGVDHVDAFLTHPDEYVKRVSEYFDSRFK